MESTLKQLREHRPELFALFNELCAQYGLVLTDNAATLMWAAYVKGTITRRTKHG